MNRLHAKLAEITPPIMAHTANELKRLLALPATGNQQLQQVLLTDPAAVVAVFRELERMRPNANEQVIDVGHAVSMIGVEPFLRLIRSLPELRGNRKGKANDATSIYSDAAHAAYYAGAITDRMGYGRWQQNATAALLQNPAALALWITEPESAQRASNAVRDGVPATTAFTAELGEPLDEANRRLAGMWSLPPSTTRAMGEWDTISAPSRVVKLADEIARSTAVSWQAESAQSATNLLADFLGMDLDRACNWLHQRSIDAARALRHIDYPLPGYQLLLLPGDDDEDDDDDVPLPRSLRNDAPSAKPVATPDLQTTMANIMQRISKQAGIERVVFAMLNKERSHLRSRLALGGQRDDGIRRVDLDLARKHLFSLMMSKPQSLWLNADNTPKYAALLPAEVRELIPSEGAYFMSLFLGDKPLGLMYGDGAQLSESGYKQFRRLCHEATTALTSGSQVVTNSAA